MEKLINGFPVIIMETEQRFSSSGECGKFLNIDKSNITKCCNGIQKTAGGYHICFEKNYNRNENIWLGKSRGKISPNVGKHFELSKECAENSLNFNKSLSKIVRCIETGEIFTSCQEAADKFNSTKSYIASVCRGARKAAKGYHFEYVESPKQDKRVIIMETEQIFNSEEECGKAINANKNTVHKNVAGRIKQCKGYHICYLKDYSNDTNAWLGKERYSEPRQDYSKRKMTSKRTIKCIETGKVFGSIAEAGKITGISKISENCNGRAECAARGYHFEFVDEELKRKAAEKIKKIIAKKKRQKKEIEKEKSKESQERMFLILRQYNLSVEEAPIYIVHEKYKFKCNACGYEFEQAYRPDRNMSCPSCHPSEHGSSKGECELYDLLLTSGYKILHNDRTVLNGKELDIYFPDINFAIEYNGKYWHTPEEDLIKDALCKEKGINLLRIDDNDFNTEREKIMKLILFEIRKYIPNFNIKPEKVNSVIRYSEKCRKIICTDTMKVYDSYKHVQAEHPDWNINNFLGSCNSDELNYKGWHFLWHDNNKKYKKTEFGYNYNSCHVKCVETKEVFPSINYLIDIGAKTVYDVLIGRQRTAYGLHWERTESNITNTVKTEEILKERFASTIKKEIRCIETGETFDDIGDVRGEFTKAAVYKSIREGSAFQGRHYEFTGKKTGGIKKLYKKIICLDTNEIFDNIDSACEKTGIYAEGILRCCRGETSNTHNLRFQYVNEPHVFIPKEMLKKVKCQETGVVYNSIHDCAEAFDAPNDNTISRVCRGERKTYKNYHFEYVKPEEKA